LSKETIYQADIICSDSMVWLRPIEQRFFDDYPEKGTKKTSEERNGSLGFNKISVQRIVPEMQDVFQYVTVGHPSTVEIASRKGISRKIQ
jgi:hypothetical protein